MGEKLWADDVLAIFRGFSFPHHYAVYLPPRLGSSPEHPGDHTECEIKSDLLNST